MKAILVFSLLVAIVAATRYDNSDKNDRIKINDRDAYHQKFILDLLHHLKDDLRRDEFMRYSNNIRIDNQKDYKDMNKVYYLVTLLRNGWFIERGKPFSLFRDRNIITTKALFDFFDTMKDWNTCAINLIWARRHLNEYQFWHLLTLLVTHHEQFNHLVLPPYYEVFPTQFFTGDVIDKANKLDVNFDTNRKLVVMSNYTTGVLGSFDDDDNDYVYDLDDVKTDMLKIRDWSHLRRIILDLKNDIQKGDNKKTMITRRMNKDVKTKTFNNDRFMKNGLKFDNNGEDRMVYFTEDIGLNNYYYFSRMDNTRMLDKKQMLNNENDREVFNLKMKKLINKDEINDKVNRRGERYLYEMKQLLARYNLERKVNGLGVVRDITLDGVIDEGVYPNLRYTNGLQMPNRMNEFHLEKEHITKLIRLTKDFEDRFYKAIDLGYIETIDGRKVTLDKKDGINIIGNLLQGNRDSLNTNYYRYLEYYYRLLFGGNHNDFVDFYDNRFLPTVLDHHETGMRDNVFWKIMKKITNIVGKYKNKLVGYKTDDVDFDGVRIKNVKIDKLMTKFTYFDVDLTNALEFDKKRICNKGDDRDDNKKTNDNSGNRSDDSDSRSDDDSMDSNESDNKNCKGRRCVMKNRGDTSNQVDYFRRTGLNKDMNIMMDTIVGRTRRLDTKKFTITLDVDSKKNTDGIVRIFLGPRVFNKKQLDDTRDHFVELDQFVVKLNQGRNTIMRKSVDFKNVVDDPETMKMLYYRTKNFLNKNKDATDLKHLNFDTINNNKGFPHRLLLPKGTTDGEDFTMFFIVSDLKGDNTKFRFADMMDTNMLRYKLDDRMDYDRFNTRVKTDREDTTVTMRDLVMLKNKFNLKSRDLDLLQEKKDDIVMRKDFDWLNRMFDMKDRDFDKLKNMFGDRVKFNHVIKLVLGKLDTDMNRGRFNDNRDDTITVRDLMILKNKFNLKDRDLDMLKDKKDDIVMRNDFDWLNRIFDMKDRDFDKLKDMFGDRVKFTHIIKLALGKLDTDTNRGRFDDTNLNEKTVGMIILKNKFGLTDDDCDKLKDKYYDTVTNKDFDWFKTTFRMTDKDLDVLKNMFGEFVTFRQMIRFVFLKKDIDFGKFKDFAMTKKLMLMKRLNKLDDNDIDMIKRKIDDNITSKDFDWIKKFLDFDDKDFDILNEICDGKVTGKDVLIFTVLMKDVDTDMRTDDRFKMKFLITLKKKLTMDDMDMDNLKDKLYDIAKTKDLDWLKNICDLKDRDFDKLKDFFGTHMTFKRVLKFVYLVKDLDNTKFDKNMLWDVMDLLKRTTDMTGKDLDDIKRKLNDDVTKTDFDWVMRTFGLRYTDFDILKDIAGDRVKFHHLIKFVFLTKDTAITRRDDNINRFTTGRFNDNRDDTITMRDLLVLKNKFDLKDRDRDMLKDKKDDIVMRKDFDWLNLIFDMKDRDFDKLKDMFGDRVKFSHVIKLVLGKLDTDTTRGRFDDNRSISDDSSSMSDDSRSMSDESKSDSNESMDRNRKDWGRGSTDRRDYKTVMIHNDNNGNKNIGNGNGILDDRVMGFPLDRRIVDVDGFITNNMFFKDVKIFHLNNMDDKKWGDVRM